MFTPVLTTAILAIAAVGAAAKENPTRFWNLTRYTVTSLQFSPPGKNTWGPNLCAADKDGEVDHDERLNVAGVIPGSYDIKLSDKSGRSCLVRNLRIKQGQIFAVDEKQLIDCKK